MGFIIALLSGALMSIQGVFNTEVTKQTSVWVAAGWVQLTAFITCVVIWLFTGREPVAGLMQVTPKYVLVGGIMGALITYTVIAWQVFQVDCSIEGACNCVVVSHCCYRI